jgi:fatty-acid desaturase
MFAPSCHFLHHKTMARQDDDDDDDARGLWASILKGNFHAFQKNKARSERTIACRIGAFKHIKIN